MTAILAMFANDGHTADEALVTRMLGRMGSRGGARASVWREGGVVIAISRHEWEFGPGFSGPVLIVQDGDHVIAADASLYYRDDLRRKLAEKGVRPKGQTPSHLILAAYQAFGEKCPEMLEGDCSFVIWDRKKLRVFCSRDYCGYRPLFYAEFGSMFIVASTLGAVLEHPKCSGQLNLAVVALDAVGLDLATSAETSYENVFRLSAGSTLSQSIDTPARQTQWWDPKVTEPSRPTPAEEASLELVSLLGAAVEQRLDSSNATSIWLSGGCDSTAVFAAGQALLADRGESDRLRPVSVSYPEGDSGREDEKITAIGEMWRTPITWVDILDVPLFDSSLSRVASRDEPHVHVFEEWMRAVSRASRKVDARVALNGHGGDFLFQVSSVYLADMLAHGRVISLAREMRAQGVRFKSAARPLFKWGVQPLLPAPMLRLAEKVRGRPIYGHFDRPIPSWYRAEFSRSHGIAERARQGGPRPKGGSRAAHEMSWYLTQPTFPRANAATAEIALQEGIEMRSPFYDRRVIEFSASRPVAERNSLAQSKRLLRRAMTGLLPDDVLVPRLRKPGTLAGYFESSMKASASLLQSAFHDPILGKLGIVEPRLLQRALNAYLRGANQDYLRDQLFSTLQAELWLRARTVGEGSKLEVRNVSRRLVPAGNIVHQPTATLTTFASGNPDNVYGE
jgi:asparagine synthase (glutamine-hydrolysing)